ncbi:addiction module protein [Blastopirellula sp. J2-11]|uniref:addiction module protein n=1 Tax=Blastopirellula sp. J2-11 TaxID=2943192 RepID=UPI0021C6391F|nr:addiction module protein [Blastopirellula sp. J2-11]UUO06951.1 addiction module protein [Blastopirellula sp. J2-11]
MSDQLQSTEEIIASALALSAAERLAVLGAIHHSLADPLLDHGPDDAASDAQAAWQAEIAQRAAEITSGDIMTIPAEEAEKMIRSDVPPAV